MEKSIVDDYFKEIGAIPLLNAEEEKKLFQKARDGDESSKEKLVLSNLRLVVRVAKSYRHDSLSILDLIQEGNMTLIKAVERFDPDRGYKFSTFAFRCVERAIQGAMHQQGGTIRLPQAAPKEIKMMQKKGPNEMSPEQIARIQKAAKARYLASLDKPMGEKSTPLCELVGCREYSLEKKVFQELWTEGLEKAFFSELSSRERDILQLRFGLGDKRVLRTRYGLDKKEGIPMTQKKISKIFKISKNRISQIEKSSLKKLRASEELKFLRDLQKALCPPPIRIRSKK